MNADKLIIELKKETQNIDFQLQDQNQYFIVLYYNQKQLSIYGYVKFDKATLQNKKVYKKYIQIMARDIACAIGKKAFLKEKYK